MKKEDCEDCDCYTTIGNVDWCQHYDRRITNVVDCNYGGGENED